MKKWPGRSASVVVNGVPYHFSDWEFDNERGEIDVTDFMSVGFWCEFLTGFRKGGINLMGPLDTDSSLIDPDDGCTIVLGIGGGNSISCPAVITKNNLKQSVKDAARYAVSARITGMPSFTMGV